MVRETEIEVRVEKRDRDRAKERRGAARQRDAAQMGAWWGDRTVTEAALPRTKRPQLPHP